MKILHYALGFPPYRTGGLTKFCIDLMQVQQEQGHCVALLWPGQIRKLNGNPYVKEKKKWNGIESFEVINPLPVALDEGVSEIDRFCASVNKDAYTHFLKQHKPDVIHLHTLMGLHREFLDAARELQIRTVFTTHDYYGLCPKVIFYANGKVCEDVQCTQCSVCNRSSLAMSKIMIMQSPIYRLMKNTWMVRMLRKRHRIAFFDDSAAPVCAESVGENRIKDYKKLRNHYIGMLEQFSFIHYNSEVTKSVYETFFHPKASEVISITHGGIKDHRKVKNFQHDVLKLVYLGPAKAYKGFHFLLDVLDRIWKSGEKSFELAIYTPYAGNKPYIRCVQNEFRQEELEKIFDAADMLIVPSQWKETFGFTALEALSYGVPVMTTELVGAKGVVKAEENGLLVTDRDSAVLKIIGILRNRDILSEANKRIVHMKWEYDMEHFCPQMMECYQYGYSGQKGAK